MSEARDLLLYLVSLHAAAHALLAWDRRPGLAVAAWAWLLAAAFLLGAWLGPRLAALAESVGRGRIRVAATAAYAGLLILAPPLVAVEPRLLTREVALFALLQPALLLLAAGDRGVLGCLANALVLVVFATLRGGALAAVAATGFLALLGSFLVVDHYCRALAPHPAARPPALGVVLRRAASAVAAPVLTTAGLLLLSPPSPFGPATTTAKGPMGAADMAGAYRALTVVALLAGGAVYLVTRLLRRARRGEPPVVESLEGERVGEEEVPPPEPPHRPAYPGSRGRIVRAYVDFVAQAARLAVSRRPSQTPREFAALLRAPAAPLRELTELFMRARYGPTEPDEDDARAAERDAETVVAALRRPRRA